MHLSACDNCWQEVVHVFNTGTQMVSKLSLAAIAAFRFSDPEMINDLTGPEPLSLLTPSLESVLYDSVATHA